MHNSMPFLVSIYRNVYLVVARSSTSFHKRICIWGTINAQFQSLFCQNVYVCGCKGVAPPCLRKFCILQAKIPIISGPFGSKFTEMYNFWWLQGSSPSFHKRMCIWGTINAQFQSLFCQTLYTGLYDLGVGRDSAKFA